MIKIEDNCSSNPTKFWSDIKNLGPRKKHTIPMQVYNEIGESVYDKVQVLKKWENDFKNLLNVSNNATDNLTLEGKIAKRMMDDSVYLNEMTMNDPLYESNDILNRNFTEDEVKIAVKKSKLNKSVGCDEIPNEALKNDCMITILKHFFQLCFDIGKVPNDWKKSILKPIPKSADNDNKIPLNYRGISLLSCISKIFTAILNNRLTKFLDNNATLVEEQNGFRSNRSCQEHVFSLHSIIKRRQKESKKTLITYIDFSKAFDCVNRHQLFYKLLRAGIEGKMYYIIKSLYDNTETKVRVNNCFTEWFNTDSGVRQGDCMSPTLFSIFVNDLAIRIKDLNCGIKTDNEKTAILLYADDVVLLADNEVEMQTMLDEVNDWCIEWNMNVNMAKTKIMEFRQDKAEKSNHKLKLGKDTVEFVPSYKYLGVYFDEHLNFEKHAEMLAKSGSRALGAVIAKYKNLNNMGHKTYTKCYESYVCPVLDYSSETWGYINATKIDSVQNKSMRVFLGVHRYAANQMLEGDMGWAPSKIRRKISLLRFWNHLIVMKRERLTKMLFNYEFMHNGFWCQAVKKIFKEINLEILYDTKQTCDLIKCKQILMEKYNDEWKKLASRKSKLKLYLSIKKDFGLENHVKLNLSRNERSVLSQLRCSILPIQIEIGRFNNLKIEERLCPICNTGSIETEYHFLFECPKYQNSREDFYRQLNINANDYTNLNALLNDLFKYHPRKLSKYCSKLLYIRKASQFNTTPLS